MIRCMHCGAETSNGLALCDLCRRAVSRCAETDLWPTECAHCRGNTRLEVPSEPRRFQAETSGRKVWPEPRVAPTYKPRPELAPTDDPVVKVVRALRSIRQMAPLLDERGEDLASAVEMPGGDATATVGPVASPTTWQRRYDLAEEAWQRLRAISEALAPEETRPTTDDESYWETPLQTLLFWSEDWRSRLDMDHGLTPTLDSEANFLANPDVLDWAWSNEPRFSDFVDDVTDTLTRMENVVRDGIRTTRSRILCDKHHPDKPHKRLTLLYGDADEAAGYIAPCCHARYTPEEAKRAHAKQMRSAGADKFITTTEAVDALAVQGWQRRTVRRWIEPLRHAKDRCRTCGETWSAGAYRECPALRRGLMCGGELEPMWRGDRDEVPESYCDVATRRTFVRWPDLWRRHLTARHERGQSA